MAKRRKRPDPQWDPEAEEAAYPAIQAAEEGLRATRRRRHEEARRQLAAMADEHSVPRDALARLMGELTGLAVVCTVDVATSTVHLHGGNEKWLPVREHLERLADGLRAVEEALSYLPASWSASNQSEGSRLLHEVLVAVDTENRLHELVDPVYALREIFERSAELDAAGGKPRRPEWHHEAGALLRAFWREHGPGKRDAVSFTAVDSHTVRRKIRNKVSGLREERTVHSYPIVPRSAFFTFACAVTDRLWGWSPARCRSVLRAVGRRA